MASHLSMDVHRVESISAEVQHAANGRTNWLMLTVTDESGGRLELALFQRDGNAQALLDQLRTAEAVSA